MTVTGGGGGGAEAESVIVETTVVGGGGGAVKVTVEELARNSVYVWPLQMLHMDVMDGI